ncbi:MAG TPA: tail fiber domain-containing protein [Chitinophagaceae bacterium]|nr:tail fiber domain-containing protein [Chitinophagaceae bacterium]
MKKIFILLLVISNYFIAQSQNVGIGTLTPAGKLHIKGSSDTSQLTIDASSTQSNKHPLIRFRNAAGTDIMHINTDDSSNVFIGLNAGRSNTSVSSTLLGRYNTFIGSYAGYSNTTGGANIANGIQALYSTTTGSNNIATEWAALYYNTTGYDNIANGDLSLLYNTTGNNNTATGTHALSYNATGNFNIAIGSLALNNTAASDYNTAIGYNAGSGYDNGYNNVFLGANVDVNGPGYYNVIAIGQGTICTSSSQVTMGNGATGSYQAYANWSNISDGRFKRNIQENVPGLDFINKLRPITYNLDAAGLDAFLHKNVRRPAGPDDKKTEQSNDAAKAFYNKALREKESINYSGFVAQEVETAAKSLGFNFSGVDAPKDANGVYGLRYAEFVVPLVKAVQEIAARDDEIMKDNETTKNEITVLQRQVDELKALIKK